MNANTIDYILFARSIPEHSKRYGDLFSCSLGYSPTLKDLVRIYPIPLKNMKAWNMYRMEVEKNKLDSRYESFKLKSHSKYEGWVGFEKDVLFMAEYKKHSVFNMLCSIGLCDSTIDQLNINKKSIGIIKIDSLKCYWDVNERYINKNQLGLFEDVGLEDWTSYTKESKQLEARACFLSNGKTHDLQINEWGVYEFYRKYSGQYNMNDAFRNWQKAKHLLIGNLHSHRNVWSVLNYF